MKAEVSLIYDFCFALGLSSLLTNDGFSAEPSHPDVIGLPTVVGLCILVRL